MLSQDVRNSRGDSDGTGRDAAPEHSLTMNDIGPAEFTAVVLEQIHRPSDELLRVQLAGVRKAPIVRVDDGEAGVDCCRNLRAMRGESSQSEGSDAARSGIDNAHGRAALHQRDRLISIEGAGERLVEAGIAGRHDQNVHADPSSVSTGRLTGCRDSWRRAAPG